MTFASLEDLNAFQKNPLKILLTFLEIHHKLYYYGRQVKNASHIAVDFDAQRNYYHSRN